MCAYSTKYFILYESRMESKIGPFLIFLTFKISEIYF